MPAGPVDAAKSGVPASSWTATSKASPVNRDVTSLVSSTRERSTPNATAWRPPPTMRWLNVAGAWLATIAVPVLRAPPAPAHVTLRVPGPLNPPAHALPIPASAPSAVSE